MSLQTCSQLPDPPDEIVEPVAGEFYYEQVGLGGFSMGEAAIVIGGDGATMLIDVANDSHVDDLTDRLGELGKNTLEHVVVTHFHADHGDGVSEIVDAFGVGGRIVHRGTIHLTNAANENTFEEMEQLVALWPQAALPMCPDESCANLGTTLDMGTTTVRFLGADATMAGERYEDLVGPLDTGDGNGENARSVVGVIEHGPFRLLFNGDLTGGGSDTDDVESFYAVRLDRVSDIDDRGVDVLHAGHHGRDTSTNQTWAGRLLRDGSRPRNVVMGISSLHLNSPHGPVLENVEGPVGEGRIWTTLVAAGGDTVGKLVDADGGRIVIATRDGGDAYVVQAIDEGNRIVDSRIYHSVRSCTP